MVQFNGHLVKTNSVSDSNTHKDGLHTEHHALHGKAFICGLCDNLVVEGLSMMLIAACVHNVHIINLKDHIQSLFISHFRLLTHVEDCILVCEYGSGHVMSNIKLVIMKLI